jgi:hypothetical protein
MRLLSCFLVILFTTLVTPCQGADILIHGRFHLELAHPDLMNGTITASVGELGYPVAQYESPMVNGAFSFRFPWESVAIVHLSFRTYYHTSLMVEPGQPVDFEWTVSEFGDDIISFTSPDALSPVTLHYQKFDQWMNTLLPDAERVTEEARRTGVFSDFIQLARETRQWRLDLLTRSIDSVALPQEYIHFCQWEIELRYVNALLGIQEDRYYQKGKLEFDAQELFEAIPLTSPGPLTVQGWEAISFTRALAAFLKSTYGDAITDAMTYSKGILPSSWQLPATVPLIYAFYRHGSDADNTALHPLIDAVKKDLPPAYSDMQLYLGLK